MQQRRLAVIMFTDIVGYTSLMGRDEKRAFEILKKNRRIHWRLIRKYKGRFLKEMGDGILASFSSRVSALQMPAEHTNEIATNNKIDLFIFQLPSKQPGLNQASFAASTETAEVFTG